MIDEAAARSLDLLHRCRTPAGFVASAAYDHYGRVWARDACIASLGALTTGDDGLIETVGDTLDTLAATASPLGAVPAVVASDRSAWDWAEGGAVDPTAWFVITAGFHLAATADLARAREWWPTVRQGLQWLAHQDVTGTGLISAAPATDWMDAALTRSGRTLHLNALYAWAVGEGERLAEAVGEPPPLGAADLRSKIDRWFWPDPALDAADLHPHGFAHAALRIAYWQAGAYSRRHYLSHIIHAAFVDRCDVLANLVAIHAGVASPERADQILSYLADHTEPFPSPSLTRPVEPGDPAGMLVSAAEAVISPRWQNRPGRYHNGAIWPYIGGFHVAAVARRRHPGARSLLERLAEANAVGDWSFPEWIDADGEPAGAPQQAWNAGTFLLARAEVERR